jgi:hypothetical protein
MPDSRPVHRAPQEMQTWEIIIAFHHARQLAGIMPSAQLSHALANFIYSASKELEERGAWNAKQLTSS